MLRVKNKIIVFENSDTSKENRIETLMLRLKQNKNSRDNCMKEIIRHMHTIEQRLAIK